MTSRWRWWLRKRCCAILNVAHETNAVYVRICGRCRFHLGACR